MSLTFFMSWIISDIAHSYISMYIQIFIYFPYDRTCLTNTTSLGLFCCCSHWWNLYWGTNWRVMHLMSHCVTISYRYRITNYWLKMVMVLRSADNAKKSIAYYRGRWNRWNSLMHQSFSNWKWCLIFDCNSKKN